MTHFRCCATSADNSILWHLCPIPYIFETYCIPIYSSAISGASLHSELSYSLKSSHGHLASTGDRTSGMFRQELLLFIAALYRIGDRTSKFLNRGTATHS